MSLDNGETWSAREVHRFLNSQIACEQATCYALLSELGSEWSGVVATAAGRNDWAQFGTLDVAAVRTALAEQARSYGSVETFGATALIPGEGGVLVAGIVNAGTRAWGSVLDVPATGAPSSIRGAVPEGLWELARDPRGRLWAGGIGAFIHNTDGWMSVWSSTSSQ